MTTRNNETDASEHLQKLEALFGGTTSVAATINRRPAVREQRQQFSNPRKSLGRAPSEFRLRLERLRMARTEEEIQVADYIVRALEDATGLPPFIYKGDTLRRLTTTLMCGRAIFWPTACMSVRWCFSKPTA